MADNDAGANSGGSTRRVEILSCILGVAVLAYVGGAFSATFRTFPYPQLLERPFRALSARARQGVIAEGGLVQNPLWHPVLHEKTGLTTHVEGRATQGYTLYASAPGARATLLNMEGEVVHEWTLPFQEAWSEPPHVDTIERPSLIYWRRVHVFPNGDLLASYTNPADTPYGYGLVKIDEDSNVIWTYSARAHHDFDVLEDGSIYVLTHRLRNTERSPVSGVPQMPDVVLDDVIVRLSPDGQPQERISLLDAFAHSRYRVALQQFPRYLGDDEQNWDPLHANTVRRVGSDFASHHSFAEPDHLMVSFRANDTIGLIDPETSELVWASWGVWAKQHDPEPLDDGRILVFDNEGHGGPGKPSRLVAFSPADNGIDWTYTGTNDHPFYSATLGSHQPLPDGHVLVTSSQTGRIFEIDREGTILWEYLNPTRRTKQGHAFVPTICSAARISRKRLNFLD